MARLVLLLMMGACGRDRPDIAGIDGELEYRFPSIAWGVYPEAMAVGSVELLTVGPIHHPVFFDEDDLESYLYMDASGFESSAPMRMLVEIDDHLFHDEQPILQPKVTSLAPGDVLLSVMDAEGTVDFLPIEIVQPTGIEVLDNELFETEVGETEYFSVLAVDDIGRVLAASRAWTWQIDDPTIAELDPLSGEGPVLYNLLVTGERAGLRGVSAGTTTLHISRPGVAPRSFPVVVR